MTSDTADSEDDVFNGDVSITQDFCCVCLQPRETTICFRPCSHAKVCLRCSD